MTEMTWNVTTDDSGRRMLQATWTTLAPAETASQSLPLAS